MGIADIIELAMLAMRTAQQMQADGRTRTTAEEVAALAASVARQHAADDAFDAAADAVLAAPIPAPARPTTPVVHTATGVHSPYPHP